MDMGELTREELSARLEAVEARIDARARATDDKIAELERKMEARAAVTDSKIDALESRIEARIQKAFVEQIKWMVGTAIAMMAVAVAVFVFLFSNITPRPPAPIMITPPAAGAPAAPR